MWWSSATGPHGEQGCTCVCRVHSISVGMSSPHIMLCICHRAAGPPPCRPHRESNPVLRPNVHNRLYHLTTTPNFASPKHACSLARHVGLCCRRPPLPLDGSSMHCGCARVRWAAHATWHSTARARTPARGESLPHGSNARRPTRVHPCSPCGPVAETTTTRACHSMVARCTVAVHE